MGAAAAATTAGGSSSNSGWATAGAAAAAAAATKTSASFVVHFIRRHNHPGCSSHKGLIGYWVNRTTWNCFDFFANSFHAPFLTAVYGPQYTRIKSRNTCESRQSFLQLNSVWMEEFWKRIKKDRRSAPWIVACDIFRRKISETIKNYKQ